MNPDPNAARLQSLQRVQSLVLRGELAEAERCATAALESYPDSLELRRALAGIYLQTARKMQAERVLSRLLAQHPHDASAAFTLARCLVDSGRTSAAGAVLRACFAETSIDPEQAIVAIELLDDCGRKADAAAIADAAIAAHSDDARLHAYAGMLEIQLAQFDSARKHFLFVLDHSDQACEWNIPIGLSSAQRYANNQHPDFVIFRNCLARSDLSSKARSTLLFAIAKAHDDIGDFAAAANFLREANALAHAATNWSRKDWRRAQQARLAAQPFTHALAPSAEFVPIFIVGMPRSGTTLTASLLARNTQVCNRGELPWLARLAQSPELMGDPDSATLKRLAAIYETQARQDDSDVRWFIDKQPLNFRYVGLILALWPHARIVHCQRNERDTALSLWMQSFLEEVQGYAYDFGDIATVMRDERRLMAHWHKRHPGSIYPVNYENLATDPQRAIAELAAWLDVPTADDISATFAMETSISTASLWQARQPVYTRSIGRWRQYERYVPELLNFANA
ncbi:MAG TPA: sulfotransferase [Rudaea sp.]|nr:sulfotransferase [Rudaea sp.]